jgi:hypothetical protein
MPAGKKNTKRISRKECMLKNKWHPCNYYFDEGKFLLNRLKIPHALPTYLSFVDLLPGCCKSQTLIFLRYFTVAR